MKRHIIASIMGAAGLVGMAATSYGQGQILFDNYDSSPYYPVVYGSVGQGVSAGLAGTGALQDVSVELGYAVGANQTSGFTLIPSSIIAINPNLSEAPGGVGQATTGWFQGGNFDIPTVGATTFEVLAWTGSSFGAGAYDGTLIWTEPSLTSTALPTAAFTAMPGDLVLLPTTPTPEPTTLALAGLGGLASLVAFRRKQS
jgi:hypothetical protein